MHRFQSVYLRKGGHTQMRQVMKMLGVLGFWLFYVLAASPAVRAEEMVCTATLGAVTVDNLCVPPNSNCSL